MTLVRRVYAGDLVSLAASPASVALREGVLAVLDEATQGKDPRTLHTLLAQEDLLAVIRKAQAATRASEHVLGLAARLVSEAGVRVDGLAIDAVRLRAVTPDGHTRAEARVYYVMAMNGKAVERRLPPEMIA